MPYSARTIPLDRSDPTPLYQQLRRSIRDAIETKELDSDDALPAERDIAADLGVSRITVRKAIDGLVEDGLLDRRHGAGTFVSSRIQKSVAALSSFSEDIKSRGWQPQSEWLRKSEDRLTPTESLSLGLPPHQEVYRLDRIRFADEKPLAIEHTIIPAACLDSLDDIGTSLYKAMERTGQRPTRALQRIQAVALTQRQAELLDVTAGDPALHIERRGYRDDGELVEVTQSYYRGDSYDFIAELNLG
jgi:GntR family transcriptional regulator